MSSKKSSNQIFELITDTGRKVMKQLGWIILISVGFILTNESYLKTTCKKQNQVNSWQCISSPLIGELGWSLFQIAIIIWFFEIGLQRETLEEMRKIFNSTQATNYIKSFYTNREEYSRLIEDNFKAARAGQKIKLLCLSEEISIFQEENLKSIREKVLNGCEIKILILHPESSLLKCLEAIGCTPDLGKSILSNFSTKLKYFYKDLENIRASQNTPIQGSIEVRLHKDMFSPIGYYSDSDGFEFVWMYFSDRNDGNEYPALHIANKELIDKTDKHFDNLWQRAVGENLLLRVTSSGSFNNIDKIFLPSGESKT